MTGLPPHLARLLDLARWAPSGDNTQPWRFELLGDEHLLLHGYDTRDHVVYDLDGHASQLAVGAMLESLSIAASAIDREARIRRRTDTPETHLLFDVELEPVASPTPHHLLPYLRKRVVQRRPMSTQPLDNERKQALTAALPAGYRVLWFEGWARRWQMAKLMFDNAKIRLTIPEAYTVHRAVIEWGAQFSTDKIPEQAVGVDPLTARLMRWVMRSWERVGFFNTYLLGDLPPRLQLDLLPGLCCGAHFALLAPTPLATVDEFLAAGRAMQRFWLTAAQLGWLIQPEMTPVIFSRYHRRGLAYTQLRSALQRGAQLNQRLESLLAPASIETLFFIGRIGAGPMPSARSTRKPLSELIIAGSASA